MSLQPLPTQQEALRKARAEGFAAGLEAAAALKEQDAKEHRRIAQTDKHLAQDARLMAAVCKSDAFRIRALKSKGGA